jgi:hypothetical protein
MSAEGERRRAPRNAIIRATHAEWLRRVASQQVAQRSVVGSARHEVMSRTGWRCTHAHGNPRRSVYAGMSPPGVLPTLTGSFRLQERSGPTAPGSLGEARDRDRLEKTSERDY